MCGIVGYIGPKKVVPLIIDGLRRLEYRGYDSAGIAVVNDGKVDVRRASGKLRNLEEAINKAPLEGTYGIGHTRWATHGRPTEEKDRKSTRLNSSHLVISYAVFCLKKKNKTINRTRLSTQL